MSENNAIKICYHIGLIRLEPKTRISKHDLAFIRMNGSIGYIERHADILHSGPLPIASDRMILHISRWDKLRDMVGIMQAFAQFVSNEFPDAYLVFAGPNVHSIQDDPEMVEAYQEIVNAWHRIPKSVRKRIQIACLPMKDREESAAIVNALERHATVICNKSLRQSLGLSVIEALWKHKPVVSSNFEGLSELMTDEDTRELFLQYPTDLTEFANHLIRTISDDQYRRNLCEFGYIHVRDSFSTFNTMSSYLEAFQTTLNLY
jgi:trehalose synthase